MAASQARYLQITARKTNTEYEGQQINQQRTMLANESAGLFSQLMALTVPTAPSTTNYTKTQYSFSDGANACTITDINPITGSADYNAEVTYYNTEKEETGVLKTRSDLGIKNEGTALNPTYWLTNGTKNTNQLKTIPTKTDDAETYQTDLAAIQQICDDNPKSQIATDMEYDSTTKKLNESLLNSNVYKYKSADGMTYYLAKTDVEAAAAKAGTPTTLNFGYDATLSTKKYATKDAYLATSDSGRYSEITLEGYSTTFDLTASTTTDEAAYEDAMSEYQYQQNIYDKSVSDINAKTEIIEQEDKTLELKLARLDTEQQALQTELDAVKKVIDKNIEETFKTFS